MCLSILADRQLVALFQKGNHKAFEELMSRYRQRVYSRICLYVKDRDEAKDVFQDTFVKAINALKEGAYNEEGKFSSWLLRIATNLCIDGYRNWKKMPKVRGRDEFDPFDYIQSEQRNYEEESSKTAVTGGLKKMLDHLAPEQKEVMVMRIYFDMSFKEIAEMLDISINTALGRMRYGLINMRKLMKEYNMEFSIS